MKYIVTGGAGFIGSNIVRLLIKENAQVEIIDNLHSGKLSNLKDVRDKIKFHNISILDFEQIEDICKNADGVFHEAALTVVQESYEKREEYFKINVKGTENIFNLAKKYNFKVVFASSSSVYGNVTEIPIDESFERKPINPYGQTKLEDEFLAEKFWKENVKIIGLRYFNVFGKNQNPSYAGVITKFLECIKKNSPPKIFGNGNQIRDFISVEDVAQANINAMKSTVERGFFNIGTGEVLSIKEIAEYMLKLSKSKEKPIYLPPLEGDITKSQANIEKANRELGWKANKSLKEWLTQIIPEICVEK